MPRSSSRWMFVAAVTLAAGWSAQALAQAPRGGSAPRPLRAPYSGGANPGMSASPFADPYEARLGFGSPRPASVRPRSVTTTYYSNQRNGQYTAREPVLRSRAGVPGMGNMMGGGLGGMPNMGFGGGMGFGVPG